MRPLSYARATDVDGAIAAVARRDDGAFLAGGTTEVDLVRQNVLRPGLLVDINDLPLNRVEDLPGGGLRIGALARMSDVARVPGVVARFPVISQALLLGASAQLRNMASMGGNLCQRVRCSYFRDATSPCNKREPGSGCSALGGHNRIHAILGQSSACIATHPSDMAVAMVALDAVVRVHGPNGERAIPILEFHRLPGDTPHIDTNLEPDELIVAVDLPPARAAAKSRYLKVRDRASYAFALVSAAVALDVQNGRIRDARIALGGVAHKPWRALEAERALAGQPLDEANLRKAAEIALSKASGYDDNRFKIDLAKRTIVRAMLELRDS